ncbi:type III secretion system (T3SS) inner membrane Yop/YscD-like protein [Luteibacter rhizovicinus]|uniref:Type III secretion system (T3SS) inner membrane Yop/YscD-like protein n=1 Tax=Luteibacter rhizovicinus TaxID=242606 RepID=A0A4R3YXB9_9GAMM|nr:FHA domain-containing protein [Luteibacter rhizovicinus]TCV97270.1 type III secretion system (T3SS) inner membrane Yop/YscD-like protein [Luteibacter rhizovicinus]
MRIEFVSSARGDFHWSQPVLRVGRAESNDLVVAEPQVAAHHVSIHQDRRGIVLEVAPAVGRVYVNARPVRERALLRSGDSLSVGDCRMLLRDDADLEQRDPIVATDHRCTVALRPVAGPLSGRTIPIGERLELGAPHSAWPLELPQGDAAILSIHWQDGALLLDGSRVPARHTLRVNGVRAVHAILQPGDQIGVGAHRFVLDAPGWSAEPAIVTPPPPAPEPLPEDAAGPRGEVWWLILTAALLALGIAIVLFVHF